MAKKKIAKYVFEPGISKDSNLYPNAVALLTANKTFLQAQVVAFINDQIANNIAPYVGYTYAPQKCTRDVGFFIDAVVHDLRYGGNVKSRQVADYFWINGEPMIRGDVSPEITGQEYLRDIINDYIFTNTAVTPSYGQTTVAQTFFLNDDGEPGSDTRNTTLWSVFSTVIENGLYAMPAKVPGVSSIRIIGNYDISDILLITDVASGEILYNFADPANSITLELKQGRSSGDGNLLSDLDFPKWYQIDDAITSLNLSKDTSTLSQLTDLQIFVEEPYMTTRPWDFGTDAIERIRVSTPQAMLDADFEYGLQPTKWQALGLIRSYPGLYEIPGSDLEITNVTTDASEDTGGFGASLITVTTSGAHGFSIGQPITVIGLLNSVSNFGRAEGSFLIFNIPAANRFTYYSSAKVGSAAGTSLFTSAVQIREAKYYTGAAIGQPTFSVFSNGSNTTVASKFDTEIGETSIAFVGTAPTPGSPISGAASIPQGTSISGTVGSAVILATILDEVTNPAATSITVASTAGIQQGMAVEGAANTALFINTVASNTLNLSGAIGATYSGSTASYLGVVGNNIQSIGSAATFDVSYNGTYLVEDSQDSTSNGIDYQPGDVIKILGTSVGGISPDNDILVTVTSVDSVGTILSQTSQGTPPGGTASFAGVSGTNDPIPGAGAIFTVNKAGGAYTVTVSNGGGNYSAGNRILVPGTALGGDTPQNDLTILIDSVSSGAVLNLTEIGTAAIGDVIQIYPILNISEALTATLPDATVLNVGAIATVQVDFTSDHGIVPGTTMFNLITSNPSPSFTSTDQVLVNSGTHTGVAFTNDVFIAISSGQAATDKSLDGETWISGGNLPSTAAWSSIAAGEVNGDYYFVAVSTGGTASAWSSDSGDTWTAVALPSSGTWSSVTYFDGRFVAVRSGSTAGAYSLDGGQSWTASTLSANAAWSDVAGGLIGTSTYFIAVASGPSTTGSFSVDGGQTWSATGALPNSANWSSITFGNNRFFAVARASTAGAFTTNGLTWTASTLPSTANWNSVAFGDDNFVIVADGSTSALTSFDATTGSWVARTLSSSATWEEIAFGDYPGANVFAVVGNLTNALKIELISANHQLAAGPFVISQVPSRTSLRYPARSTGFIDTESPMAGSIFVRPDAFFVHRPFDGGVQLGTGGPAHGSQAIRQSKKYVRYQSGKGIMYTTGALFAPSYNLSSAVAAGAALNSFITFTCDDTDHGLQPGAEIEIIGMISFEYNGTYTVEDIVDSRSFRVRSTAVLSTLNAELGSEAKVVMQRWRGATVRVGAFDEQNGIFYQYNGETMAVVIRKSTNQLIGTVSLSPESNLVTGAGTRFQEQLKAGDKIVIRGMTHTVARVINQTNMTVAPDWRGANSITGAKVCITEDMVIPQSDWNMDTLDGTGASGYNLLPWRMQMIGIQYTWYAAGFVEFMLRGADGRFIFLHRIRNSNVNTEAYMRTANLPVRYEVENASAKGRLKESITDVSTSMTLADALTFPSQGIVYINNEIISYTGKTGNTLTGLTRAASMTNFAAGQNRTYTAGLAAAHTAGVGVILLDVTCSPTISHWGSAILTDGMFDEDRGYLFNYAATGLQANTTKQTAFMIRLAPSVSNALIGDLGERDLLNRAQLLLNEIQITANSQTEANQGAIVIEGVLNPKNYPDNPANITWNGLSSTAAGGQPSFAQIALGGSINWGGVQATTTTATVQGALTTTTTARAFTTVSQNITARSVSDLGYGNSLQIGRTDFLIRTTDYDNITATPLRIGDRLSAIQGPTTYLNGQTIASITRNYVSSGGTSYTRIVMSSGPFNTRSASDQNVTVSSVIASTYFNAFSTSRTDFLVTDTDANNAGFLVGDTLTSANVTTARTIQSITSTYARVSNVNYTRVIMDGTANSTSGFNTGITTTFTAAGTAATYTGNFLFFTNATFNSSGATAGTRVATSVTQFPAGTAITGVEARTLGPTTVRRVTFTQSANTSIAAAANITFQFGDPQVALPGEQVFSFVTNPGNTVSIDLSELKELTTTAIGGRGAFPNGPDVLAINVLKIAGTVCPVSVVLRWGEAQA